MQEALDVFLGSPGLECRCGEKRKKDEYNLRQANRSNAQGSSEGSEAFDTSTELSQSVCMIALHACGDLTVDASNIYLQLPSIQLMILIPCCYHKMSLLPNQSGEDLESGDCETFRNFPLSDALRRVFEATSPKPDTFLRRPFLRLASQLTPYKWAQCTEGSRELNSIHLMGRAILELFARQGRFRIHF